jgi:hypothetical protein
LNGIIKIVCERVEPEIRDDLCDFAVAVASRSPCFNLRLVNLPAARRDTRLREKRSAASIFGAPELNFLLARMSSSFHPTIFPIAVLGGEAVFTAICLGHYDRKKFAQFAAKASRAQRLVEVEVSLALELASEDPAYEDVASKFWEHFIYIANAMNHRGDDGIGLWDEMDGFFYDVLKFPDGSKYPMRVRSMVGLIPLFAVETLEPEMLDRLPGFKRRLEWFIDNRPDLVKNVACMRTRGMRERRLLSTVSPEQLRRVLHTMLNDREFLSRTFDAVGRCSR